MGVAVGAQKVANSAAMMVGVAAGAIPLLLAATVLPLIGRVYLAIFESASPDPQAIWTNVAIHVVEALPALILSWTMHGVFRVLMEYGHGRHLSLRASRSLMWVGLGALVALLLNVAVVPVTVAALRGSSLWTALDADVFDIGLLMFAAGIVTIGGALEAAARDLQNEHDQIV